MSSVHRGPSVPARRGASGGAAGASSALQHHFESLEQQKESSTLGMWLFLVTEVLFFGGLFLAYLVYRTKYPAAFVAGSHHLDVKLGVINTAVLIGSSLTMAMAVWAAQVNRRKLIVFFLLLDHGPRRRVPRASRACEYSHKFHTTWCRGRSFTTDQSVFPGVNLRHARSSSRSTSS